MKTFVVLAVSIVLVGILFCPMVIAAPPMPTGLQMVQPDPSLPKELAAFWGKWEGRGFTNRFLIVEKIDNEKASLYFWDYGLESLDMVWGTHEAQVIKEGGKYKLFFSSRHGPCELILKGEVLIWSRSGTGAYSDSAQLRRVP